MPTALLSVSDKTGLVDGLARHLHALNWDLLASGGTANALREASLPVQEIAEYTNSPEILDGRVKTLHPAVHGGLLARDTEKDMADLEKVGAAMIDLVAVNLYPFRQTIAQAGVTMEEVIENIDIGGVALIRAAAKNFQRVAIITAPADYEDIVVELKGQGEIGLDLRRSLAEKAFVHTAEYDAAIAGYLTSNDGVKNLQLFPVQDLRYGENPHQQATLYGYSTNAGPMQGELLQGKPLSYNNLLDLDAAWRAAISFDEPTVCLVKHLSPCGLASSSNLRDAYVDAFASDPISAFGGVIAANQIIDADMVEAIGDVFIECICAPGFSTEALEMFSKRKNLRLLQMPNLQSDERVEMRSIHQGVLAQSIDSGDTEGTQWQVVSERQPDEDEMQVLRFAWKACQHVKSNAIVFVQGQATVGIGGGQPNRVDCVHIAAQRAGEKADGSVMASDAFFPYPDSVEAAATYGIKAIISPGGSIRDQLSIDAANKHGIAMVFTGTRHFRH